MPELRKDYVLDRWVVIAAERGKRPHDFTKQKVSEKKHLCVFCPGNEKLTPPEVMRIEKNGKWLIRVFPNKYQAFSKNDTSTKPKGSYKPKPALGNHEILVETPSHKKQMWDFDVKHIMLILETYIQRISSLKGYTLIFKNHGEEAGTSLVHSHTQLTSSRKVPPLVEAKVKASARYRKKHGKCAYCDVIRKERSSSRLIMENKSFIAIAPFASWMPLEAWILPKKHIKSITEVDDIKGLAEMLKKLLMKLKKINAPYNFYIHNAPKGKDLHFMIVIEPRLSLRAGFEYGTGMNINVMPPEKAAAFYKGENK